MTDSPRTLSAIEALARADDAVRREDAATEAVAKAIDPQVEANEELELRCAAIAAVNIAMKQKGLTDPTLLTAWGVEEFVRILKMIREDPFGEIKLGNQYLGKGFQRPAAPMRTATVSEALRRTTVTVGGPVDGQPLGGGAGRSASAGGGGSSSSFDPSGASGGNGGRS